MHEIDVFDNATNEVFAHNEKTVKIRNHTSVITLIPSARVVEELAQRRNCPCPN